MDTFCFSSDDDSDVIDLTEDVSFDVSNDVSFDLVPTTSSEPVVEIQKKTKKENVLTPRDRKKEEFTIPYAAKREKRSHSSREKENLFQVDDAPIDSLKKNGVTYGFVRDDASVQAPIGEDSTLKRLMNIDSISHASTRVPVAATPGPAPLSSRRIIVAIEGQINLGFVQATIKSLIKIPAPAEFVYVKKVGSDMTIVNNDDEKIGQLSYIEATAINSLMVKKIANVYGQIPTYAKAKDGSIHVNVFIEGKEEDRDTILSIFKRWNLSFQNLGTEDSAPINDEFLNDDNITSLFECMKHANNLELAPNPKMLATELFRFQRQGLSWLIDRESPKPPAPGQRSMFWEHKQKRNGTGYYYNTITRHACVSFPEQPRGGILADDMGLGKTLQILSLICSDIEANQKTTGVGMTTLIICPLAVVSNWINQIELHAKGNLSYYVYHGMKRNNSPDFLKSFDIILSTYGTVTSDYQASFGELKFLQGLFKIDNWRRLVLDEGHSIKSKSAVVSKACIALKSSRRWLMTGTPIQNKLDDLYNLIKFIKFDPFDQITSWNKMIVKPLKAGDTRGIERLQILIGAICIRRKKNEQIEGKPIIILPDRNVEIVKVHACPKQKLIYELIRESNKKTFDDMMRRGLALRNYMNILDLITRQRQICNHYILCLRSLKKEDRESVLNRLNRRADNKAADENVQADIANQIISPETARLLNMLKEVEDNEEPEECSICFEFIKDGAITPCSHTFCHTCILMTLRMGQTNCPLCRAEIKEDELLIRRKEVPVPVTTPTAPVASSSALPADFCDVTSADGFGEDLLKEIEPSAKINRIITLLNEIQDRDPDSKTVIFSQWVGMIKIIEHFLKKNDIGCDLYVGSLNMDQRNAAISNFRNNRGCRVLLASLRCAGFGLNLTEANNCILVDPWWNLAAENQAIDRVHRIGQKKTVYVYRLVIEDSVEEKILMLQEQKETLVSEAFGEGERNHSQAQREKVMKLKILFS